MREKISQREARRNLKALREANKQLVQITNRYGSEFPGINFHSVSAHDSTRDVIALAQRLGFGVACKMDGNVLRYFAVRLK